MTLAVLEKEQVVALPTSFRGQHQQLTSDWPLSSPSLIREHESATRFYDRFFELASQEEYLEAGVHVYTTFHDHYRDSQFDIVDSLIRKLDVEKIGSVRLLLAFVLATRAAASKLRAREEMMESIRERLRVLAPDELDQILAGLR